MDILIFVKLFLNYLADTQSRLISKCWFENSSATEYDILCCTRVFKLVFYSDLVYECKEIVEKPSS